MCLIADSTNSNICPVNLANVQYIACVRHKLTLEVNAILRRHAYLEKRHYFEERYLRQASCAELNELDKEVANIAPIRKDAR